MAGAGAGPSAEGAFEGLPWGFWQARVLILCGLCKMPTAWQMAAILFTTPKAPEGIYRCAYRIEVPTPVESDGTSPSPWDYTWRLPNACKGDAPRPDENSNETVADMCLQWEYVGGGGVDVTVSSYITVTTQWALVCERSTHVSTTQFCYLFGILVGGSTCMKLLPRVGPRRVILVGLLVEALMGFLLACSPWLVVYMITRSTVAAACAFVFTASALLCADLCIGLARGLTSSLYEIWWSLGIITLALIGPQINNWRLLQATFSIPAVLLLWPCLWFLPESPRWLVSRGRVEEAARTYEKGAALNRRAAEAYRRVRRLVCCRGDDQGDQQSPEQLYPLPAEGALMKQLEQDAEKARDLKLAQQSAWLLDLFRTNRLTLMRVILVHMAWAGVVPSFFGGLVNFRNLGTTPGHIGFMRRNTAFAGVAEIFGFLIGGWLCLRASRPWLWLGLILTLGGSAYLSSFATPRGDLLRDVKLLLVAVSGRVSVAAALPTLFCCTPRLVPASHAPSLVFSCLVCGRIVVLGAPFTGNLAVYGEAFPLAVFGCLLAMSGLSALLLEVLGIFTSPPPQ